MSEWDHADDEDDASVLFFATCNRKRHFREKIGRQDSICGVGDGPGDREHSRFPYSAATTPVLFSMDEARKKGLQLRSGGAIAEAPIVTW